MVVSRTQQLDPRSIVTPDAFEGSVDLLGTPLATPRRRALALAIDGIVIAIITLVTGNFALILGIVAAGIFLRAGFKRTPVRGSVFGRAMRFSVGCLGIFVAIATALAWAVISNGGNSGPDVEDIVRSSGTAAIVGESTRASAGANLADAGTESDALRDAREAAEEVVDEYSLPEALAAYADVLTSQTPDAEGVVGLRLALEARLTDEVARGEIDALERTVVELADDLEDERQDRQELQTALDQELAPSLLGVLRDRADDLGFGFSWAILYTTVFLSWWNGQTVGKRMMNIRVVRLDGEPITWWIAFERAGGYAAGFATGLLGFAQVWWDSNRQGIHDRIVGTVVVVEGAEKVIDWESAL